MLPWHHAAAAEPAHAHGSAAVAELMKCSVGNRRAPRGNWRSKLAAAYTLTSPRSLPCKQAELAVAEDFDSIRAAMEKCPPYSAIFGRVRRCARILICCWCTQVRIHQELLAASGCCWHLARGLLLMPPTWGVRMRLGAGEAQGAQLARHGSPSAATSRSASHVSTCSLAWARRRPSTRFSTRRR